MKFRDILLTASNNMFRSKLRSFLTIIAIFIGAMTLTLTNGIGSGIATYIDEQVGNIGAEDMLLIQGKGNDAFGDGPQKYNEDVNTTSAGGFPMTMLTQKDLEKIKSQPGVLSAEFDVTPALDYIQGPNNEKYAALPNTFAEGLNLSMASGELPVNKTSAYQVVLPLPYVSVMGFSSKDAAVGQTIRLGIKDPEKSAHVVEAMVTGVQEQNLISEGGIIINRPLALALYDIQSRGLPAEFKNQQPFVLARFDKSLSEDKIKELKSGLDQKGYNATTIQDQIGIFKQVINAIIMVLNVFAGIALLAASFGIINTLLMAVQERTKEIGLMKAMGMSGKRVFLLFSIEAILLGFWGSLLGSLAGIGIGKIANKVASQTFLKDLTGFELTSFPLTSVVVIMLIVMSIAFVAGTLPARRASRKDPIEALRYE